MKGELVDLTNICRNFPVEPEQKISRLNLIEEIERQLNGLSDVVFLKGGPLSGKSTIAADFYKRNRNCIAVFFGHHGDLFRSPDYLRVCVVEQICWITTGKTLDADFVSDNEYNKHVLNLQKYAKKKSGLLDY